MTNKIARRTPDALSRATMSDKVMVQLRAAEHALAIATTIQATKLVLDVAAAQKVFAARHGLSQDCISHAHRVEVYALGQLGELLQSMPKAKGGGEPGVGRRGKKNAVTEENRIPTLSELGISKKTSMIAQQLAVLPLATREAIANQEQTLSAALNSKKRIERHKASPMAMVAGAFQVLLADPAWSYRNSGLAQSAESQYETMSVDQIGAMELPKLLPDAVCFLWVPSPLLPDGIEVLRTWKFTYKTGLVWVKDRAPGMGWFCHTKHEHLLVGTTGQAQPAELVDSVFAAPVGRHSVKPTVAYELIERMYPTWRKVELFARQKRDGWESWGDQLHV